MINWNKFRGGNPRWCVELGRAHEGVMVYAADRRRLRRLIAAGARNGFKVERILKRQPDASWGDHLRR